MTSLASPQPRVLADRLTLPSTGIRRLAVDATLVATGALLVAVAAQIEVPLWPVPVTGQTLAVLIVGTALGPWRGAASLLTYALVGLAGLPVFAGFSGGLAAIGKPSFGFVLGFILAALVAGWFARRTWDRKPALAFLGFIGASIVPFLVGVPYMAFILNSVLGLGFDLAAIIAAGVTPFIIGGLAKAAIAAAVIPGAWAIVRRIDNDTDKN